MITTIDTTTKLKTVRFTDTYDLYALDLSGITRHDNFIHIVYEDEFVTQSIFIEKDKRTKWYKMRIIKRDMIHDIVLINRTYLNLSFDNLKEFKQKIKELWKLGEKI